MANDVIVKSLKGVVVESSKQIASKVNPLDALNNIANHVGEWQKIKEEEKTKRQAISSQRDVMVESIRAERDTFIKALELNYQDRAFVYTKSFEALDKALESGNIEIAQGAMSMILEQIKNNPLPSFGEFKQSFLKNQPLDF